MDEKELERLYNAVNSKFDIGDYNTFRTRMQTPEDRKKFYDVVGSKGFDLGEYPFYEERLSGVKKKPVSEDGSTVSANGVSKSPATKDPLQEALDARSRQRKEGAVGNISMPRNASENTATNLQQKTEMIDDNVLNRQSEASLKKENEEFKQQALKTTAERRLKSKGKAADEKALTEEKAAVQKDIDEGNLILSSDGRGNKIFARQPGMGESFLKNLSSSINSLADAGTIAAVKATGSPEELAALYEMIALRKRQEAEKEFTLEDITNPLKSLPTDKEVVGLPTAEPGVAGTLTGMVGGLGPDVAMAMGTGGLSAAARTAIIASKMELGSYGNKAPELYEKNKQENIRLGMSEQEASIRAAQDATVDAVLAAAPDAAVNTLFFSSGKLHTPLGKNLISALKATVKNTAKVSGLGVAGSLGTSIVEGAEGYNVDDWFQKAIGAGGEFAEMELIFSALRGMKKLPKATRSLLKEFAVDPVVNPVVESYLKSVPEDIANRIRVELQDYKSATEPVRGVVPEEKMASLGGRMQKRQNRINGINIIKGDIEALEAKKKDLPETLHEEINTTIKEREGQIKELEKEIESVDKEIGEINKSKETGLEKEIDEATGEPLIPKGEPEQISQPIELSTEVGELKPGEPAPQEAKPTVSKDKKADIEGRRREEILNRKGNTISQSEVERRFIEKRNSDKTQEKLTEGLNHTNGNVTPEKRWIDKDDAIFQELVDLGVKPDSRGVIDNTAISKAFSENESRLKKEVNEEIKQEGLKRVTDEFRKQDDKQKFEKINAKYDAEIAALPKQEAKPTVSSENPALSENEKVNRLVFDRESGKPLDGADEAMAEQLIEKAISKSKDTDQANAKLDQLGYNLRGQANADFNQFVQDRIDGKTDMTFSEWKNKNKSKTEAATVSSEGELTQRQLDNREKKRIEDIVDSVEGGDIKGSSISVGDKDLVEYLIDAGMWGREAHVVKAEIERLINPLKRITDKIDPEELKFLTENVEDINSVMEGLEDAKMIAFSRNKDIVDGVNKEAKRLLDFYSDKNNLADNKLDTESTFAAKVDLLDKFLKGELNYLDLSKFGVEKKAKDYFKPKIKQGKKPTQSKEPSIPVSEGKTKVENEVIKKPVESTEPIASKKERKPETELVEVGEGGGKPPKGEEPKVAEGEDRNIGITHKRMDELANEYGMPTYEKDPQTVKEWDEQATARIKKDPDSINKLMNKMREGNVPDPVEQRMMLQYIASLDAKLRSNPTPELLKELNRAKDISNIAGGRLWGQIGAARKGFKTSEDTLGGYLTTWTEAHGSETLPKETIKDLTARFDKEQELKTKIDEAYAKGREEAINEMAAEGYSKERSGAKKGKTDYKSKRQELKDRLKKEFDEYLSEGKKLGIAKDGTESFRLSLKMAKTIGEYVKTFAEEGIVKLDDVINKVYEEIKDVFPATKKDIRDVIAGVYKEPKATRNELAETVRNLQTEANLLNKIEQERLGYEKAPTAEKIKRTARIEELQKRLEEVKKLKKSEVADEPVGEKSFGEMPKDELAKFKEKRLREIAKLKERIKSGDYAEKPKVMKPIKLDKEAQRLEEEYEKMKEQDTYEQEKAKYDRLSKATKAWDKVLKFLGVKRIIQTAFDVSIPFRQNVVTTMNPRKWLPRIEDGKLKTPTNIRQFKNMFTFLASPKAMKEYIRNLKQTGEFYEMEKDGIQFSDPSEMRLTKREEDFRNNIFEGLREYRDEKNIALKGLSYIGEPIFASERAAAGALNTVRVERYRAGKRMLEQQGITRQNNPEAYVKLAEWVMNLTGRGKMLEMIEESGKAKKLMGNTFYGARLMASRINLIKNPFFSKMPKELRVQAFKDMAGFSSGVVLTGLALMAAGGKVSFDPDSPDFMQVRFGDKVYDITGGMSAYMKIFFRMTKAAFMQSKAIVDKSEKKDANDYARFFGSSGGSFITNKLAPNTATIYHLFKGKSPGKDEFDPTELIEFYPMYVDDMKDAWGDEGASALLTLLLPNLFGIGTNEYPDKGGYEASKSKKQGMPQKKQKPTKEKKFAP